MTGQMRPLQRILLVVVLCPVIALCWPSDPRSTLAYNRVRDLLDLQKEIRPPSPASLLGAKLPPNYLTGFLSLGTGQELLDAQDQLLTAWNSSDTISKLIANEATQAPVQLPDKFKSGALNKLLGELVVLYYATWQGVESARRQYYRQVEETQLKNQTQYGAWGVTNAPLSGKQFVPERLRTDGFFINRFYSEEDPTVGNGVTAYSGTYIDLSKGPLLFSFPKIDDFFVITFYNAYGEVVRNLGTRAGNKEAFKVVLVSEGDKGKVKDKFPESDIITVPGVDALVLSRILGKQRAKEYKVETVLPGQQEVTSTYWWGTDAAVYYIYNELDPLYFWKVAGLVLARNPRQGLTSKQRQLLKDLQFTDDGLQLDKLTEDQKLALIAAIPIASQGLAQSFYVLGPKWQGYWYITTWNSIPGSYFQLNSAFFKGFWLANTVEYAAFILQFLDSEARPLNGRFDYTITFKTPPPTEGAFWSLQTMRLDQFGMADAQDTYLTRDVGYVGYIYGAALSDSTKATTSSGSGMVRDKDGAITITLSARAKPNDFKGNYLRTVADVPFYSVLRIYSPSDDVVQDKYAPPPFVRQGGLRT